MRPTLALLILVVVVHFSANALGIYDTQIAADNVWIDNVLHVLVGLATAFFFAAIASNQKGSFILKLLIFVGAVAVVWELCEFAFYILSPTYASELKIYSPSVQEAGADILSNLGGAVLYMIWRSFGR